MPYFEYSHLTVPRCFVFRAYMLTRARRCPGNTAFKKRGIRENAMMRVSYGSTLALEALSLTDMELVNSGILSWLSNPRSGITRLKLRVDDFTYDQMSETRFLLLNAATTHITTLKLLAIRSIGTLDFVLKNFPSQSLFLFSNIHIPLAIVLPYGTT